MRQQPFAWYAASLKTSPASEFHNATVSDEHNRHLKQVDISEASSELTSYGSAGLQEQSHSIRLIKVNWCQLCCWSPQIAQVLYGTITSWAFRCFVPQIYLLRFQGSAELHSSAEIPTSSYPHPRGETKWVDPPIPDLVFKGKSTRNLKPGDWKPKWSGLDTIYHRQ